MTLLKSKLKLTTNNLTAALSAKRANTMKIEIHNIDPSGVLGYRMYNEENKPIRNSKSGLFPYNFDETEISFILGEKEYQKFEEGKHKFDIPKWKIDVISGVGGNFKTFQLKYEIDWIENT